MATCNAGSWRLFDAVQRPGVIYVDAYGTNARPRPDNKAHPALPRPDKTGLKDAVAHRWARVAVEIRRAASVVRTLGHRGAGSIA